MIDIEMVKSNVSSLSEKLSSLKVNSIFLEQDGNLDKVFYDDECLHELRSCSKILVSMAVGIAIDKGMISLDTCIYPSIKDIVDIRSESNLEKIRKWKISDLLIHTTGYESQMMSESFIKDIDKDKLLDYALNYDIPYDVGIKFAYNNVEPFILSVFFQETFGINLTDFINENIFIKLDIKEYKWSNYGRYCPGATGLYLRHTDFHKIGKLLLSGGLYNNIQVVPKSWIKEMCSMQFETPEIYKKERVLPKVGVGYFTFISRDGFIFRDGSNGQYIIVNKDKNLLITIMSTEKEMQNITEILRGLI